VLRVIETKNNKSVKLPQLPIGTLGGLDWHENSRDLGFTLSTVRSPSDVFSIDVRAGKLERWTESETGGLNTAALQEPELVKWKSFDARQISGFLYRPPARFTGKRPVVIRFTAVPKDRHCRISSVALTTS
jgi:dipeptidyl aminopeptidase/acylaminoacyl peptidase